MRHRNYSAHTSLLDVLFLSAMIFMILFILSFVMINTKQDKKADIETKAEFIVTVTWPDRNPDDVDTWIEDPEERTLCYRNKHTGLMHLDRDDLGLVNDMVRLPDGTMATVAGNQEIAAIRGFIPGEWTINVHMYHKRIDTPTPVHVLVQKLNPVVKTLLEKTIIMDKQWQEETVMEMHMTAGGEIISIENYPKNLVKIDRYGLLPGGT